MVMGADRICEEGGGWREGVGLACVGGVGVGPVGVVCPWFGVPQELRGCAQRPSPLSPNP